MILSCNACTDYRSDAAKYQDKRYGQGRRVHNRTKDGEYICTVCEHRRGGPKIKRAPKLED